MAERVTMKLNSVQTVLHPAKKVAISGMKTNIIFAAGAIGLWLAGCATSHDGLALDSVGPDPTSPINAAATTGTLLVYSAFEVNADFNRRDSHRPEYSDYRILTADGKLQQRIHNNSGTILQRPKQVDLPAGKYRIIAQANGYGSVTVPVVIEAGQNTILHLEGGFRWPNQRAFDQANAVRLPDGEIVGWKDTVALK